MNKNCEIDLISNLPLSSNSNLNPKRSFAFDTDISTVLSSLGCNHSYLDQWQQKRRSLIISHMWIMDTVYQSVSKECDISIQKTEHFIEFLRVKSLQIHKFSTLNIKAISSRKYNENCPDSLKMDPFAEIWPNMDLIHSDIQKKAKEFSEIIDQKILKSILLEEQRGFTSVFSSFKTKILAAKKKLEKLDQETNSRFSAYCRIYNELVKEIVLKKKLISNKSLYLFEHEFLSSALDHEKIYQEFTVNMIIFFKEIRVKERFKSEKIKESLAKYYDLFTNLFKSQKDLKIFEGFFNEIDAITILKRKFDFKNLLSEEQILKTFKKTDLNLEDLENFIGGFKLEEIVESELILGKFTCMRQLNKTNKEEKGSWIDSIAIITKDSWLLIINYAKDMYDEPDYLLDLSRCSFHDRNEEMVVVINEKNKGWCKKALVHWIKLDSNSDRENFVALLKGGQH